MTGIPVWMGVLVLIVGLAIAPAAGAAFVDGALTLESDDDGPTEESSIGTEVSTFMQANSADQNAAVDRGMFEAAYENADDEKREALLEERVESIDATYERLEADFDELYAQKNDTNPMAYNAQLIRLTVQLSALESSIDETEPRAEDAGIDTEPLQTIRENARELAGPEVAEIATGLSGIDPPGLENGALDHDDTASSSETDSTEQEQSPDSED